MARVTIDESASIAAKKLARDMGWTPMTAIGSLYFLWRDSQALEQTHCTVDDVSLWLSIDTTTAEMFIQSLVRSKFLEKDADGYVIRGNDKHIQAIRQKKEASRSNGKLGGRPVKYPPQAPNIDAKPKDNLAGNLPENHSAVQCSAVQGSTEQYSTNKTKPNTAREEKIAEPDEDQRTAELDWLGTLEFFEAERKTILPQERKALRDAIRKHGIVPVRYAVVGSRFESKTDRFDPGQNLQLRRVLDQKNFEKFINLGAKHAKKIKTISAKAPVIPLPVKEITVVPFVEDA